MNLSEYTTLTGLTVASSDHTRVTAELARSQRKIESLLGYTLTPANRNTNFYNELGKTESDYSCPIVDTGELEAPDAVVNGYRLFPYNPEDTFLAVDPFTTLNKVKLVYIRPGAAPNGVTVKTFDEDYISSQKVGTWSKYLYEYPRYWYRWHCAHTHQLLLAVDANWAFETVPEELNELVADFTTYYSDDTRDLKSESILTHSYTRKEKADPSSLSSTSRIIAKYAGPNGTAYRTLIV